MISVETESLKVGADILFRQGNAWIKVATNITVEDNQVCLKSAGVEVTDLIAAADQGEVVGPLPDLLQLCRVNFLRAAIMQACPDQFRLRRRLAGWSDDEKCGLQRIELRKLVVQSIYQ